MLASPIFWQAPLAKKRLKKRKQKKRFRIPQPKFSRVPESGFPYMVRVAHLTENECFGSLCFDTNTPAFLMQIMLKNSEKKSTSFSYEIRNEFIKTRSTPAWLLHCLVPSPHYSALQTSIRFRVTWSA